MAESTTIPKFLPYTGVIAGALFVTSTWALKVSDEYADPTAMQLADDHAVRNYVAVFAAAFFCVAMLWFVSAVREALRPADGRDSVFTQALFGGGVLVAASQALFAWVLLSGLDAADQGDQASFQTLSYLGIDSWVPWAAGSAVFFLATGIAALSSTVMPRWFAIVTIVLGVMCMLGPAGIAVYLVTPLWLAATGVLLARRHQDHPAVAERVAALTN